MNLHTRTPIILYEITSIYVHTHTHTPIHTHKWIYDDDTRPPHPEHYRNVSQHRNFLDNP